jgi:hypothetical protein
MEVVGKEIINKSISEVWDVMGNQFADVHLWSSNFKDSKSGGQSKLDGLAYLHRITTTERGETIQELDAFSEADYSLTYHISKGAPEIAEKSNATWSLKQLSDDKTEVSLAFFLEPKAVVPAEMLAKIEMGLTKSATEMAEELKHYLENNTPHPRNLK